MNGVIKHSISSKYKFFLWKFVSWNVLESFRKQQKVAFNDIKNEVVEFFFIIRSTFKVAYNGVVDRCVCGLLNAPFNRIINLFSLLPTFKSLALESKMTWYSKSNLFLSCQITLLAKLIFPFQALYKQIRLHTKRKLLTNDILILIIMMFWKIETDKNVLP